MADRIVDAPHRIDLTGRQFGHIVVLGPSPIRKHSSPWWNCRCCCGHERAVRQDQLLSGGTKSCGCKRKRTSPEERFWRYVRKTDSCWLWTGGTTASGYGSFAVGGRYGGKMHAHRFAYQLANGPIGGGLSVLHDCDKNYPVSDTSYRRCVNPAHLKLGTHKDNMEDMKAKGRGTKGRSIRGAPWLQRGDAHYMRRRPDLVLRGEDAPNAKIAADDVRAIRSRYAAGGVMMKDLAAEYGLHPDYVSLVIRRHRWKHIE